MAPNLRRRAMGSSVRLQSLMMMMLARQGHVFLNEVAETYFRRMPDRTRTVACAQHPLSLC